MRKLPLLNLSSALVSQPTHALWIRNHLLEPLWRGSPAYHRAEKLGAQTQPICEGPLGLYLWSSHSLSALTCCMRAHTLLLQLAGTCCMASRQWPTRLFTPTSPEWCVWLKAFCWYPRGSHKPSNNRAGHKNSVFFPLGPVLTSQSLPKEAHNVRTYLHLIHIFGMKYLKDRLKPSIFFTQ